MSGGKEQPSRQMLSETRENPQPSGRRCPRRPVQFTHFEPFPDVSLLPPSAFRSGAARPISFPPSGCGEAVVQNIRTQRSLR